MQIFIFGYRPPVLVNTCSNKVREKFCRVFLGVLRGEDNYAKNRNYWKYLKAKLMKENNELVRVTNQLNMKTGSKRHEALT
jgi:hypothetical protein